MGRCLVPGLCRDRGTVITTPVMPPEDGSSTGQGDDWVFGLTFGLAAAASRSIVEPALSSSDDRVSLFPVPLRVTTRVTISSQNAEVCTLRIRRRPQDFGAFNRDGSCLKYRALGFPTGKSANNRVLQLTEFRGFS